jgi:serine/threonine-protein kinase
VLPSGPPVAPVAGQTLAGWRLLRALGRGAHGTVFLAEPTAGGPRVALKLTLLPADDPAAQQSFLRQAEAVRRLSHPDIVALLGVGLEGGIGWLAMEPVPGCELGRYARPSRLLPEALTLGIAERVARALAHAHREGYVHRDLKPANVLVHLPADVVKLADLGLARPASAESTRTGVMAGTPAYMAPEQLAGALPDARSDLYALGVTLFHLLTGRLPHEAPTLGELLRRVSSEPAPDLRSVRPELPRPLAALLARLLERQRQQRASDAEAVADALRAVRRELPRP